MSHLTSAIDFPGSIWCDSPDSCTRFMRSMRCSDTWEAIIAAHSTFTTACSQLKIWTCTLLVLRVTSMHCAEMCRLLIFKKWIQISRAHVNWVELFGGILDFIQLVLRQSTWWQTIDTVQLLFIMVRQSEWLCLLSVTIMLPVLL